MTAAHFPQTRAFVVLSLDRLFFIAEDLVVDGGSAEDGVTAGVRARLPVVLTLVVVPLLDHVHFPDELGPKLKENAFAVGTASVLLEFFAHGLDGVADLEGRAQLYGHGGHQMVSLEQHQRLPIDFLQLEVLHVVGAAGKVLDEIADLGHRPLKGVVGDDIDIVLRFDFADCRNTSRGLCGYGCWGCGGMIWGRGWLLQGPWRRN